MVKTGNLARDLPGRPLPDEVVDLLVERPGLRIEGEATDRELGEGDWILLPAHCRHRVTWTRSEPSTVWLAIHFHSSSG